jgi:hypothetical protein
MFIDPLGVAIGALAHNVLGTWMLPAPPRRAVPAAYSYRRVRPFPLVSPHFPGIIGGPISELAKHSAWHEENARREFVRARWRIRQAIRAARPPKGHDHPEWV